MISTGWLMISPTKDVTKSKLLNCMVVPLGPATTRTDEMKYFLMSPNYVNQASSALFGLMVA